MRVVPLRVPLMLAALFGWGCSSPSDEIEATRTDGGNVPGDASRDPPPERPPIWIELMPFWDIPWDATGWLQPEPLADAEVCVARRREYEGSWEDFKAVDRDAFPCVMTEAETKVRLQAPSVSELIVTASKDGYLPRAIPVTTGQRDSAAINVELFQMHLFRLEVLERFDADASKGQLFVFAVEGASFVPGVSVQIEPGGAEATYLAGGLPVPGATSSLPGDLSAIRSYSGALFTNLAEDEYTVHGVREGFSCDVNWALPGFTDRVLGAFRAPVLDGHFTNVGASCACLGGDAGSCAPADAAAP